MRDDGDDDPDRAAILSRRRKLIAVALAGLTSAAGCGDDADPMPCLSFDAGRVHDAGPSDSGTDAEPIDAGDPDAGELDGGDLDGSTDAAPMACLTPKPGPEPGDGDASA